MRRQYVALCLIAVGLVAGAAHAALAEDGSVPLYTNKDLERFRTPAPTTPGAPVRTMTAEEWQFIQSFIDNQYARLDAERERSAAQHEGERFGNPSGPYTAPYAGVYGYGYGYYPYAYRHDGPDPNAANIYRHGFGNPDRFPARYATPSARYRDQGPAMHDGHGGGPVGGKPGHGGRGGGGRAR